MSWFFFVEMAWKSSAIAAATLLLAGLLRSRSAADRAAVLTAGAVLLLMLPLLSLLMPVLKVGVQPNADVQHFFSEAIAPSQPANMGRVANLSSDPANKWLPLPTGNFSASFAALLYLVGVGFFGGRILTALFALWRWTSAAERVSSGPWTRALARLQATLRLGNVSLLVSSSAPGPLSWGWRKPVILLDPASYARAEDAEAVLAHETAHLLRRDWTALMLFRLTDALFWFNPLVWLMRRQFVHHAEAAADSMAARQVGSTRYAEALLDCARSCAKGPLIANSIISPSLVQRVQLITAGGSNTPSGSLLTVCAISGCVALAGPLAALKLVPEVTAAITQFPDAVAQEPSAAPMLARYRLPRSAAGAGPTTSISNARHPALPERVQRAASNLPPPPAAYSSSTGPGEQGPRFDAPVGDEAARWGEEAARLGEEAARSGERAAEIGRAGARAQMSRSADDVGTSAEDVRLSARHLAAEAVNLRDPAYREQKIAEQARRGRRVSHQELIDSIPKLKERSRELLQQADRMHLDAGDLRRRSLE